MAAGHVEFRLGPPPNLDQQSVRSVTADPPPNLDQQSVRSVTDTLYRVGPEVLRGLKQNHSNAVPDYSFAPLHMSPETSKGVIFRTWIATIIADAEPLLNDIDVLLRSASTYISVVGFPAAT
eukprot:7087344-Prymnesium_polylepis.1